MNSKTNFSRRNFLKNSTVISIGFLGLQQFAGNPIQAVSKNNNVGYGNLVADPEGVMDLPEGFSYKIISRLGDPMDDGMIVPGKADGMAAFPGGNGKTILVRNHELSPGQTDEGAFGYNFNLLNKIKREELYDYGRDTQPCLGGTTTVVYNEQTQSVERQFLSLAGTIRNCAGGPTPWNSWITCEENVSRASDSLEKDHGFNFEVPATSDVKITDPVPLKDMGRFNHEAVAVDPDSGIVYQTEDRSDGLIYRFIPNQKGELAKGGKLQALVVKGEKSRDTRNWEDLEAPRFPKGETFDVEWMDMDNILAPDDDLRHRGFEQGAAKFARGEGMWYGNGEIYFACTNGGRISKGQVFRYKPSPYEGTDRENEEPGKLDLFAEPNETDLMKNCDNLTVAPWGDVILCEDHPDSYLVGVNPKGELYHLGHNVGFDSEMAGATFSPSGDTLFVNIQGPGLTLAITGPWRG